MDLLRRQSATTLLQICAIRWHVRRLPKSVLKSAAMKNDIIDGFDINSVRFVASTVQHLINDADNFDLVAFFSSIFGRARATPVLRHIYSIIISILRETNCWISAINRWRQVSSGVQINFSRQLHLIEIEMFLLKLFALALACSELLHRYGVDGAMDIATFNSSSYQQHQSGGSVREALLNRLSMILCNLDVKSIYVCFDSDKVATNMVNQVIARVAHCSSVAITLLRYSTPAPQTHTHTNWNQFSFFAFDFETVDFMHDARARITLLFSFSFAVIQHWSPTTTTSTSSSAVHSFCTFNHNGRPHRT